jgi:uncharacterized membrane protein
MDGSQDGMSPPKKIGSWFRDMTRKERWTVIVSIACITIMISMAWYALAGVHQEKFTEFYVLNEQGQAFNYPSNLTVGEEGFIIVGLANHEGRTVNYTVEVWLLNYTLVDMAVNVTQMYYIDSFTVVLESVAYKLDEDWVPQYEKELSLNLTAPGNYSLIIMLFDDVTPVVSWDGTPVEPVLSTLDRIYNYNMNPYYTWRVILCVNQDIPYLKLVMMVI